MNITEEPIKKLSTVKFDVILLEDGIIENVVKEGVYVERKDVLDLKRMNLEFAAGGEYGVLVSSHYLSSISKEARELSASPAFVMDTIATAIVVDNIGHRLVGEFYLQVNKPRIKTRLFTKREEAIGWLRSQVLTTKKG